MYCLRPGSNVKLHVPNLMLMSKFYCSTSFALDSAHVKFDVWPEPYSSLLYFALTCFTLSYPPQSTSPVILDFTSRSPHLTSLQLSSAYLNLFYPNHTVTRELSFSLSFGFCKGSKVPWNLTQTSRFLRVFYNIKYWNCQRLNSCAFFLHKSVELLKNQRRIKEMEQEIATKNALLREAQWVLTFRHIWSHDVSRTCVGTGSLEDAQLMLYYLQNVWSEASLVCSFRT